MAAHEEWLDTLWDIWIDWIGEFEGSELSPHPVRQRDFRWALYQMLCDDFVFDLRSQVEVQIARHERRALEVEQSDLFPEA